MLPQFELMETAILEDRAYTPRVMERIAAYQSLVLHDLTTRYDGIASWSEEEDGPFLRELYQDCQNALDGLIPIEEFARKFTISLRSIPT